LSDAAAGAFSDRAGRDSWRCAERGWTGSAGDCPLGGGSGRCLRADSKSDREAECPAAREPFRGLRRETVGSAALIEAVVKISAHLFVHSAVNSARLR